MKPLPLTRPSLLTNWPRVLRQAWSIRFSMLAACFTAAEVVLPFLGDLLPRGRRSPKKGNTTSAAVKHAANIEKRMLQAWRSTRGQLVSRLGRVKGRGFIACLP